MTPSDVQTILRSLEDRLGAVVFGSEASTRLALIALMARGHLLLEGVPGTGKTLFARTFSRAVGLADSRLQCTPDLMPGDVLGANVFDFNSQKFHLTRGPIFTEFLLADEINRTPPKTQSALLEAMQERAVTIDGTTHALSPHFIVVATQNPVEHEGTYPLPEAQLDRFLFKLVVGYPTEADEIRAAMTHGSSSATPEIGGEAVLSPEQVAALQAVPGTVHLDEKVATYAVHLSRNSRAVEGLSVGLSPRASTMLVAAARAAAACEGRAYVIPDDVKALFIPVARHRVVRSTAAEMDGTPVEELLTELVDATPVPR